MIRFLLDAREQRALDRALARRSGLAWSRLPPCPLPLYDAASAQIGSKIYVFGGFVSLNQINAKILVLEVQSGKWGQLGEQPDNLAQSHAAVATDGARHVYVASGQRGAQCSPAVRDVMSFDTHLNRWTALPPLPAPRYAGTMQLWRGRLHFVGGAKEDRWTPAADHWSLEVSAGIATEVSWTRMNPIPVAAMHRGSAIVGDKMFVLGGQQGDFVAIPGDPDCRCDGHTQETYLADCFRLDDPTGDWKRIADLPVPVSHTDFATFSHDRRIFLLGGQAYKDPDHFYLRLTDMVQAYDPNRDCWSIEGRMPYPLKFPVTGLWDGKMISIGGQRGSAISDHPGPVTQDVWSTSIPSASTNDSRADKPVLTCKKLLFLSHEISLTGASLLLLETARKLKDDGAEVRIANLGKGSIGWTPAARMNVPMIPAETALDRADDADFLIANTVSQTMTDWVRNALSVRPELARKLIYWIHEIDIEHFMPGGEVLKEARLVIFDSEACRNAWVTKLGPLSRSVVIHPAVSDAMMVQLTSARQVFPLNPGKVNSETASLTRSEARDRLGVKKDEFLVLCIGTVEPRKGQALLLKTLAKMVRDTGLPIRLALVGFKNSLRRAEFLLRMSPSERRVLSPRRAYVRQSAIAGFYRAADALVMNTQGLDGTGGECFGRVTIEAMAAGAAVLGTDAGGTREIIQDGHSGYLFPVGREGQAILVDRLERLLSDPSLAARMSEGARLRINEHFNEARYIREFVAAIEESFGASR